MIIDCEIYNWQKVRQSFVLELDHAASSRAQLIQREKGRTLDGEQLT